MNAYTGLLHLHFCFQIIFFCCFDHFFLGCPGMLSFVILRALGLDTWLGGLLNYVSCLVGESTKCFGNGTDERNAKSTDGYQSFRFLVWENGWELDGMGFMKDYQLFWIVNQNHGSVNNESLQILWNITIFIQVPLPWLLEKVSWICPGLIAPEKYPFFV